MLPARKVANFPFNHAEQSDKPAFTNSADLKAAFDSRSETMRLAHNGLIDDLTSVTPGSSGAEQLGSAPIAGVAGDTPHEQMSDLKAQVNTADGKAVTAQENLALHSGNAAIHTTQAEKDKLAGIQAGAEVNQSTFAKVAVAGQADIDADAKTDVLTLAGGVGITITTDPATDTVRFTATGEAVPGPHASSHITGGADVIPNAVAGGSSGLMSGADKTTVNSAAAHIGSTNNPHGTTAAQVGAVASGDDNTDMSNVFSMFVPVDTRSQVPTAWDAQDRPTTIEIRNGAAVLGTITITYNADGKITQLVLAANGKTVTYTQTWAGARFTGRTKAVA